MSMFNIYIVYEVYRGFRTISVTFGVYRFRALILMVVRLCVLHIDVSL